MTARSQQPEPRRADAWAYGAPAAFVVAAIVLLAAHPDLHERVVRVAQHVRSWYPASETATQMPAKTHPLPKQELPHDWRQPSLIVATSNEAPIGVVAAEPIVASEQHAVSLIVSPREGAVVTASAVEEGAASSTGGGLRFPNDPIAASQPARELSLIPSPFVAALPESADADLPPPAEPAPPAQPASPPISPPPTSEIQVPPASELSRPVEQPAISAPQLGTFTAHGTISLADVRLLALHNNKEIAVLGQLPQITAATIEAEISIFDPVFNIAMAGGRYNRQVATLVQGLGVGIPTLRTGFWQPINGLNQVYLEKLFVTGGKAQIGLGQNYLNYSPAGDFVFVNPSYQSSINLLLEQPLLRGRGAVATMAPTNIARANQQQSWFSFQATVNQVLRDAENAYWEMYAAFQEFEARDVSLAQAFQTLERERGRLQLGEGSVPDAAQAEEQCEMFRIARTVAETRLVNAQRNLRRLMGLEPSDPRPLIPATTPFDAPVQLDWSNAADAAQNRPEFAAQAAAVEAANIELARRRNGLLPDISARAIYSISGLDDDYDQAWANVGSFRYEDWTVGVLYKQPLGRRNDRALCDRAMHTLALETARLKQLELEILHQLDTAFQNVQAAQRLLELHRRRREAAAVQMQARRELYMENRAGLREELDAELRYASALYDESLAQVNYQRAMTDWNYARGAIAEGDMQLNQ